MKKIIFGILLVLALTSFYKINSLNYEKSTQIRKVVVEHPELLPTKETAYNSSAGFANIRADMFWLQAIQYIGGNAISSEYKKYLYAMLDIITELNPFFEHPYIIGELLLPNYNQRYEDLDPSIQAKHIQQAVDIGKKGVANFCDEEKLQLIKDEYNLKDIWSDPKYKNPCKSYKIAYNLGFIYYYYLHDGETASYYYKIASANTDSPEGAKIMTAIMQGKGGNREKSFFMFLNMASTVEQSDELCTELSRNLSQNAFDGRLKNDTQSIKAIETLRNKLFPVSESEEEDSGLSDTYCLSYLNKAIRELNLSYIEEANKRFEKDHDIHAGDAKELVTEGYIDFLPTDAQKGIIYVYNDDLEHFDYEMGEYFD